MIKGYIFDWDGTLANTLDLTYRIYRDLFLQLGKGRLSFKDFKRLFGREHRQLYDFIGVAAGERKLVDKMWLDVYKQRQGEVRLFPFAKELLKYLKSCFKVGLVSSGKKWRVTQELEILGISDFFDIVVTVKQIPRPKPAPDGLLVAAKKLGMRSNSLVYVGDMAEDVIAGKAAGMKTAIVTHGMRKRADLLKLRPDFVLGNLRSLETVKI